jgi:hypothetical protein
MSITHHSQWQPFIQEFNRVATHRHRYEVFKDFVLMSAITMHNSIVRDQRLEAEYLQIVGRYSKQEVETLCQLFARLILLLDPEPCDVLGTLYMSLDLGNTHVGQFFTPPEVSELMARINHGEELREIPEFVTLSEPACGAGGMVLAFVKVMLDYGHNPASKLWVHCQDIDRIAAMMCYLQLALWNIPAMVVVGNTLAMESREVLYTPQHHLGLWRHRLKRRNQREADKETVTPDNKNQQTQTTTNHRAESAREDANPVQVSNQPRPPDTGRMQFDFGF